MSASVLAGIWKKVSRVVRISSSAKAQNAGQRAPSSGERLLMISPVASAESGRVTRSPSGKRKDMMGSQAMRSTSFCRLVPRVSNTRSMGSMISTMEAPTSKR